MYVRTMTNAKKLLLAWIGHVYITLEMYTWQIMCSPGRISLLDLVRNIPRPWQPDSGLQIYVLCFLALA